jgi:hypothetical protein
VAGLGPSVPSGLIQQPTPVCNQAEDRARPAAGQTPKTARNQPVLAHQRLDISAQSSNFQSTTPLVERQLTLRRRSDTLMVGQKGCLKFLYTAAHNAISDAPQIGSPRYATSLDIPGLRFKLVERFPYAISYMEHTHYIDVIRIVHEQWNILLRYSCGSPTTNTDNPRNGIHRHQSHRVISENVDHQAPINSNMGYTIPCLTSYILYKTMHYMFIFVARGDYGACATIFLKR